MNSLVKRQNDKSCIKLLYDDVTDRYISNEVEICEKLNKHFTEVGTKVQSCINVDKKIRLS